jgi:hypothetical protein
LKSTVKMAGVVACARSPSFSMTMVVSARVTSPL